MSEFSREIYLDSVENSVSLIQQCKGDVNCIVWDAAIALSKYLDIMSLKEKSEHSIIDKSVLELGAGTGCVGLACSLLGASKVVLTDLKEHLGLLEKNVQENFKSCHHRVTVSELKWGNDEDIDAVGIHEVIVISDCLYYLESIDCLVYTIKKMCSPTTLVLLSYEEREANKNSVAEKAFFQQMSQYFHASEVPIEHHHSQFRAEEIHIFVFRLKQ